MVLADTSVWVDHLRHGNRTLADLLEENRVVVHPFVIGELACGHLNPRREILSLLHSLPTAERATDSEALELIERRRLMGSGLGLIDIHLLASALLENLPLWSLDALLQQTADELGLEHCDAS